MAKKKEICLRIADFIDTALNDVSEAGFAYAREDIQETLFRLRRAEHWARAAEDLESEVGTALRGEIEELREGVKKRINPVDFDERVTETVRGFFKALLNEYCECLKELKKYV